VPTGTQTALILKVPEAESIVGAWRERYDPSAREGVPAHMTVLFPFVPFQSLDESVRDRVAGLARMSAPIELSFPACRRFPGVLWLAPQEPEPVTALIRETMKEFPDYPPYEGAVADIIPHLTIAYGDDELLDGIELEVSRRLSRPILSRIDRLTLLAHEAAGWRAVGEFDLQA
jgi:2'-5' RNA ligase